MVSEEHTPSTSTPLTNLQESFVCVAVTWFPEPLLISHELNSHYKRRISIENLSFRRDQASFSFALMYRLSFLLLLPFPDEDRAVVDVLIVINQKRKLISLL